jgi:poly-gamma-glutamate synthesis protein (capsule biosynthesis protein)
MPEPAKLIGLVGDLLVDRANPDEAFDPVRDVLAVPDLVTANCECAYAENPEHSPGVTVPVTAHPSNIPAIGRAGIDVVTLANNHALDAGHRGLFEMQRHFEQAGILHCGAGRNIEEARRPALARAGDLTVAVLSYATFFPRGYEALDDWAGLAPIRSFTTCRDRLPNVWSPGTPPIVSSVPLDQDMDSLRTDIEMAGEAADLVIVQLHGGDYHRPFVLSEFELKIARAAVDSGAHAVAAHHHHLLRGMEWYRDAPIFYGLGHFVFDLQTFRGPKELVPDREEIDPETDESYDLAPRKGWPYLPWHRDARMTMLAWVRATPGAVESAGFLPCMLNREGQVYPVSPQDKEGIQVSGYIRKACEAAGLNASFEVTDTARFGSFQSVEMVR